MADPKGQCQVIRERYQNAIGFWGPRRDAMGELERFIAGDRYQRDHGSYNRDRRLTQIRGQETQDTIRHIAAKATEKPRSIETRPIDHDDDPDAAELAATLVEGELGNPWKGFDECYEAAIISAREKRLGTVWMDWDPECGPFGEILYRYVRPDQLMWEPSFEDPHHPLCPWLIEEPRLEVELARELYGAPWLEPDKNVYTQGGEFKRGTPLIMGANGERLPGAGAYQDDKVTLWKCWYKNDKTKRYGKKDQQLPEAERYMSCKGLCGYKTKTQAETQIPYPEEAPRACPDCSGDLMRIDVKEQDQTALAYSKGRRLVIMAPFCQGSNDEALYDDRWPIPTARSFPAFFITAYQKPGEPTGPCDTDFMWDQQIAADNMATVALQRIFENRDLWIFPRTGIFDTKGKRYERRDDQFNIAFRDGMVQGPLEVEHIVGSGLDSAWPVVNAALDGKLTRYRGVSDLGPLDESRKSQSGIAIAQLNQIGEIPVAHFNRRKNRELSKFYGVVWDYVRATYTPNRLSRLNIDGVDMLMALHGDELPNFDFVISDTPDFTGLEKAKSDAFTQALQIVAQFGIEFLQPWAEFNNVPRSVVRKLEKILQAKQLEAEQQAMQLGGAPGMTPEDLPLGDMGAGAPQGLNGAGMGLAPGGIEADQ